MEDKIKDIVAAFIKVPADQINNQTVINKSALKNSIMVHRMYAQLANAGIVVSNYVDIDHFGALVQRIGQNNSNGEINSPVVYRESVSMLSSTAASAPVNIGIDVEDISMMPRVSDFREDAFYQQNFSSGEIAHCILQQNPFTSFAGLFAAKEAIVKADNNYRQTPFRSIHIDHSSEGKPLHSVFHLSITHTDSIAIAVAVRVNQPVDSSPGILSNSSANKGKNPFPIILSMLAVVLALIAIIFAIKH